MSPIQNWISGRDREGRKDEYYVFCLTKYDREHHNGRKVRPKKREEGEYDLYIEEERKENERKEGK